MKQGIAVLIALMALWAAGEKQPLERYQSIIDRMPFGQPPPGFDPTRDPSEVSKDEYSPADVELTQEQEEMQKAVRFSVINVESDGTVRVGFSDMSDPKAPRHFYLAVGETRSGWVVKDADVAEKTMTVSKDGVEVELKLGENSGGIDGKAVANARAATNPGRSALLTRQDVGVPMSHRGRRERREAEEAARRAEDAKREEELRKEREERERREEEERAAREQERAEQREQLNAIKAELQKRRAEAKAAAQQEGAEVEDAEL